MDDPRSKEQQPEAGGVASGNLGPDLELTGFGGPP